MTKNKGCSGCGIYWGGKFLKAKKIMFDGVDGVNFGGLDKLL